VANSGPQTANPHDFNRTPGGSSCGSAAAVADQQVPLSLGAQTGGSLIRPASFNGVFAFKPTHNTISLEGTKIISASFDTIGFFARSIDDLQLVANVFNVEDDWPLDNVSFQDCSVALVRTPMWSQAGPGTVRAMEKTVEILESHGVEVEQISLPVEIGDPSKLKLMQNIVISKEAANSLLKEYRKCDTHSNSVLHEIIQRGTRYTAEQKSDADHWWNRMRKVVDELAANYSVIIAPSAIDEAPSGRNDMGSPTFNTLWTVNLSYFFPFFFFFLVSGIVMF